MNDRREAPHATEEDLILHYYGEAASAGTIEAHLTMCHACRDEFDRLRRVLELVDLQEVPEPPPSFERDVWARLEPQLTARRQSWLSRWLPATPKWAYAGGFAVLLLVAFVAGRMSRPDQPIEAPPAIAGNVTERVLVVAIVDHLDRSQMMLVELLNTDFETASGFADGPARARELVATNRLYRRTAVQAGDEATGDVLDDLERTLLEIANTPSDAPRDELEALRARIEARGLLFRVRIVHSEMQERERQTVVSGSTS